MNPMVLSAVRHAVLVEGLTQRVFPVACGDHFTVYTLDPASQPPCRFNDIIVVHHFTPTQIDNNIASAVANELLPLVVAATHDHALYSEQEMFERYVGAVVRSIDGDEQHAWQHFYANTLQRMASLVPSDQRITPDDFIANFGAIYQQVCRLIGQVVGQVIDSDVPLAGETPGRTLLDVATCFGFFPLLLASADRREENNCYAAATSLRQIVGCDLNAALVNLASDYARQQRIDHVAFVVADILADTPASLHQSLQAPAFDIVTAIHLLEHLDAAQMKQAMTNLWHLTRQRLIIAVPLEEVPDPRFGHVQTFNRDKLLALGQMLDGDCQYFAYHGGWLVVDRERGQRMPRAGLRMLDVSEQWSYS